MVRARRAKRNPARAVVPAVAVAAVLVAAVIWWRPWTGQPPSAVPSANGTTAVETPDAPATTAKTSPSASASGSASPSETSSGSAEVAVSLRECRATVSNGDALVAAARQGLSHWSTHVQAQADADKDKITADELGAIFARTRVAGNDQDTPLWARTTKAWDADENSDDPAGACKVPDGATTEQAAVFEKCQARADGLPAAVKAADKGMADWMTHLTHMKASRDHYVHNAQDIWIDDYDNAGPHLAAWKKADAKYGELPACS